MTNLPVKREPVVAYGRRISPEATDMPVGVLLVIGLIVAAYLIGRSVQLIRDAHLILSTSR